MKSREVQRGIQKLDPNPPRNTGDKLWTVDCPTCHERLGWTKISAGGTHAREIHDGLVSTMAKQLQVPGPWFRDLVGCTKALPDYLAHHGHEHVGDATAAKG